MLKFGYKNIIILCLMLLWAVPSYASTSLECEFTKYNNSNYSLKVAESWVPRLQTHSIYDDMGAEFSDFNIKGKVKENSNKKIVFSYIDSSENNAEWKYTYFKTNNKVAVQVNFPGYLPIKTIWGKCNEVKIDGSSDSILEVQQSNNEFSKWSDNQICKYAVYENGEWSSNEILVNEAKSRGLNCVAIEGVSIQVTSSAVANNNILKQQSDDVVCSHATKSAGTNERLVWRTKYFLQYVNEAQRRGLTCEVNESLSSQVASSLNSSSQSSIPTSTDTQIPLITITRAETDDKQGIVAGRVSDNVGVAEVTVDGNVVPVTSNGSFEYSTYVPATGLSIVVEVTDLAGLSSSQTVSLERNVNFLSASISFDRLNPIATPVKPNRNALALIIGVSDYENTPARAIFADSDAMVFHDYASEKLGIPDNRIKTLVNDGADIREFLLSTQNWISRSVKQEQTDVYVFFAGHGLASDDGEQMYLLPYDGSPELLDRTAILRDELFSDIASANPRSVTVFLDTCYSGSTRGSEMLIAARPILLKAKESAVPEGFTVFTAAAGDETAKPLEEAKHGMFSYFLMKGMEGDADTNGDKQITAGELHAYVKSNVVQQSSGTQTPELQGDADRVLVRFE